MQEVKMFVCTARELEVGMCIIHGTVGRFGPAASEIVNVKSVSHLDTGVELTYRDRYNIEFVKSDAKFLVVKTLHNLNP